tara:strand:+ start:978 stop:1562 length:585 start_codon:yes stop_codon:yes gene_type:complete
MKKLLLILCFAFSLLPAISNAEIKAIKEGNVDAKVKLILFESLTCSHCANFHKNIYPALKKDFLDKGLISIEYKNFPLDLAALNASKISHCRNDGNSKILHFLFNNQSEWVKGKTVSDLIKNLNKYVNKNMNFFNLKLEECLNNSKIEDHILEDRIEGVKKYKVNSTPTLLINGKKFENTSNYKKLKNYIEKLI